MHWKNLFLSGLSENLAMSDLLEDALLPLKDGEWS